MFPLARILVLLFAAALPSGALRVGFYWRTCPNVESLVWQAVSSAFVDNPGIAPGLVRMHFHDCFVRGCDASVLLAGNGTERTATPNLSLRGFEVIDAAKAAVEAACPATVSCADILAFAARDSSRLAGNIWWNVPAGRRDGSVSIANDTRDLPPPSFNASQLVESFANKSLTANEMVTLSGAHSFGIAHCTSFRDRLYQNNSVNEIDDPTISPPYATLLRRMCPATGANGAVPTNVTVKMDIITPDILDNKYYVGVLNNLGLFTSDAALNDPQLVLPTTRNALSPRGWAYRFKRAMVRMGNIEVLEGTEGEIRTDCSVVNAQGMVRTGVEREQPGRASS